eukprot:GHVP01024447.1.p1 GENE.GHVP01024447.1~~GHVP01024447.1.p1  ORF type:complete len:184 (-),score=35.22 GHVP01024447.1:28-579(-)
MQIDIKALLLQDSIEEIPLDKAEHFNALIADKPYLGLFLSEIESSLQINISDKIKEFNELVDYITTVKIELENCIYTVCKLNKSIKELLQDKEEESNIDKDIKEEISLLNIKHLQLVDLRSMMTARLNIKDKIDVDDIQGASNIFNTVEDIVFKYQFSNSNMLSKTSKGILEYKEIIDLQLKD